MLPCHIRRWTWMQHSGHTPRYSPTCGGQCDRHTALYGYSLPHTASDLHGGGLHRRANAHPRSQPAPRALPDDRLRDARSTDRPRLL